jgi:3-hydroxyisobutyrate dehydrogenase-like beta-hydroxyacid dehydrogenase
MTPVSIAVVGLGNMGTAIAERLLDAGYGLAVYNRTPGRDESLVARGAMRLDAPTLALATTDVCVVSLPDDAAVDAVVCGENGVLAGARSGTTLIETSTISVSASAGVAEAAAERGVAYLRAPFSGNPTAIRGGTAVSFVSGDAEVAKRCDAVLRAITPTVHYVGDGERARALKLVLQIFIGGTAELLAEAIVLGEAAGLERRQLLDVIRASVIGSKFIDYKSEPLLHDDYSATFTTAMMLKDVDLILDLAQRVDVTLPLTAEFRSVLQSACEGSHADEDFISVVLELKERSGARTPMRNR